MKEVKQAVKVAFKIHIWLVKTHYHTEKEVGKDKGGRRERVKKLTYMGASHRDYNI